MAPRGLLEPFGILKASWSGLGGLLGRPGKPLGRSWGGLGCLLGVSWALLGRSWRHLERSWRGLGGLLGALGHFLGALGAVWEASWPVQVAKMPPEGNPEGSKIDFQRHLALKTRILQKVSLGLSTSIKHRCSSKIQNLYFDDTNPVHWLARIHLHAPEVLVTDEFGQEI